MKKHILVIGIISVILSNLITFLGIEKFEDTEGFKFIKNKYPLEFTEKLQKSVCGNTNQITKTFLYHHSGKIMNITCKEGIYKINGKTLGTLWGENKFSGYTTTGEVLYKTERKAKRNTELTKNTNLTKKLTSHLDDNEKSELNFILQKDKLHLLIGLLKTSIFYYLLNAIALICLAWVTFSPHKNAMKDTVDLKQRSYKDE